MRMPPPPPPSFLVSCLNEMYFLCTIFPGEESESSLSRIIIEEKERKVNDNARKVVKFVD